MTRRRTSVRKTTAALTAAALLGVGAAALSDTATAADSALELRIQPGLQQVPGPEMVFSSGTGFQSREYPSGDIRWQSYADGRVDRVRQCAGLDEIGFSGDRIGCTSGGHLELHDFATDDMRVVDAPSGDRMLPAYSDTQVLAYSDTPGSLQLIGHAPVAPVDTPVTAPAPVLSQPDVLGFDDDGAFLRIWDGTGTHVGMLDFAAAKVTYVPASANVGTSNLGGSLGADWLVQYHRHSLAPAFLVSRKDGSTRTVPLSGTGTTGNTVVRQLGDWLIVNSGSLTAVPIAGGTPRTLLPKAADQQLAPGTDNRLLTAGGTGPGDWGVHRVGLNSSGVPQVTLLRKTPQGPVDRQSIAMGGGEVSVRQNDGLGTTLQGYRVALTEPPTVAQTADWACTASTSGNCQDPALAGPVQVVDEEPVATGDGRLVSLSAADMTIGSSLCSGCAAVATVRESRPGGTVRSVTLTYGAAVLPVRIIRASGRYVLYQATQNHELKLAVADIDAGRLLRVLPYTDADLWGATLWTPDPDTPGHVDGMDVRTGQVTQTVDLRTGCRADELQVVGRWFYSACAGSGRHQVFDRQRGASITLPDSISDPHQVALGDGFIGEAGNGTLTVVNVRTGTAGISGYYDVDEDLPNAGEGWTVDRHAGYAAVIDKAQVVHLIRVGGASSQLTALDTQLGTNLPWQGTWWLSKPGASWTVTIKQRTDGRTVRTLTGGQTRGVVKAVWDGKDGAGKASGNGTYDWALSVRPADGAGAAFTAGGSVKVTNGAAVRRDHLGVDGVGDMLTLNSKGEFTFHQGTGAGAFSTKVTGAGWSTSVKAVPFGDLNGDRCNDVLVRVGDALRAYKPACGKALPSTTAYTSLGTGWSAYNVLTSPGDLTGDGRADLLARRSSTSDVYLFAATSDGRLKAGVKIRTAWTSYTHIVGAGDLNGDGHGDVLVRRSDGTLFRYDGIGNGLLKERVTVFTGWGASYTAIVGAGDITGDGKADIVVRDKNGVLYRNNGYGNGKLSARTQIATGWTYTGVF